MAYASNVWDKDALKNPEMEYHSLLGLLRNTKDFGMLFVRCSPAEGKQIIKRTKADAIDQIVDVLRLDRPVADFYKMFVDRTDLHGVTVLFVTGIEEFLEGKVKDIRNSELENFPRPLLHLSILQTSLKARFSIKFVFFTAFICSQIFYW